jgi:acetyltransferase-like isoleucine patch superfamily enzyme
MLFAYPMGRHGTITIHDDALIGSGVHFYTANHSFRNFDKKIIEQGHDEPADIILMDGCWIGANVILLPGVTIGRNTVVGAGSVVTKSLPDNSVAVGNPARVIRTLHRGNMHN